MSFKRITLPDGTAQGETEPREINVTNVQALANRPQMTAAALKAAFDAGGISVKEYLTGLVNEINGFIGSIENNGTGGGTGSGASNIGAGLVWPEDHSEGSVQAKLIALKEYMDGLVVEAGAGDMAKSVYDSNNDGVVNDSDHLGGLSPGRYLKTFWDLDNVTSPEGYGFTVHKFNYGGILQNYVGWNDIKAALKSYFDTIYTGSTVSGSSTTNSATGRLITHTFGNITTNAYRVTITPTMTAVPTTGTTGGLGEVYVVKNADGTFTVYNTGIAGIAFDWQATKV